MTEGAEGETAVIGQEDAQESLPDTAADQREETGASLIPAAGEGQDSRDEAQGTPSLAETPGQNEDGAASTGKGTEAHDPGAKEALS